MVSPQPPPPTIQLILNRKGVTLCAISPSSIRQFENLTDHVSPESRQLFDKAMKTQEVVQNLQINFMWEGTPTPYLVSVTPGYVSDNIHVLCHLIPPGASPEMQIDPREAHRLKGLSLQFESLTLGPLDEELTELRELTRSELTDGGGKLSPYAAQQASIGEEVPFNLKHVVKNLTLTYFLQCRAKKKLFLPPQGLDQLPSATLHGDLDSLNMILTNLLTNAVKYTAEESGTVQFSIELHENPNSATVKFLVIDSGQGIPEEHRARVFAMGDRLGAEAGSIEGQGIGLSAAKEAADTLGWKLDFYPNKGSPGTTFFLEACFKKTEPLVEEPAAAAAGGASPLPFYPILPKAKKRGQINILFIEDNEVTRRAGKMLLKNLGITAENITEPTSFDEAVALSKDPNLDLIIADHEIWESRVSDGIIRERRALETANGIPRIPIILCSANAMDPEVYHAFGGTQVAQKPYRKAVFDGILNEFFLELPKG